MRKRYLTGPPVGREAARKLWPRECSKWAGRLWLNGWTLRYETADQPFASRTDAHHTAAQATYTPAYQMATLAADEGALATQSEKEVSKIACHEATHLLFAEADVFVGQVIRRLSGQARGLADDQWEEIKERLTTKVTDILAHPDVTWKD